MADYDTFTGVYHIGHPSYMETLGENMSMYIDWAFLNIGAFQNVRRNQTTYGQDPSVLRNTGNNKVFESYRKNWVWESGINYQIQPIKISGVYINSQFYTPAQTGYKINYRDGQIIFTNPVSGTVQVEYSYKLFDVYKLDNQKWFAEVLSGDWTSTFTDFAQAGSGTFNILVKNRVNLPFIGIEVVPRRSYKPYQLGGGQWVYQDVLFWIAATEPWMVQTATDAISFQNNKNFKLFNLKDVRGRLPYLYDGSLNPSGLNYKQLIDTFPWKNAYSIRTELEKIADAPLFINTVRMTLEGIFGEI